MFLGSGKYLACKLTVSLLMLCLLFKTWGKSGHLKTAQLQTQCKTSYQILHKVTKEAARSPQRLRSHWCAINRFFPFLGTKARVLGAAASCR